MPGGSRGAGVAVSNAERIRLLTLQSADSGIEKEKTTGVDSVPWPLTSCFQVPIAFWCHLPVNTLPYKTGLMEG